MNFRQTILLSFIFPGYVLSYSQSSEKIIQKGNQFYKKKQYSNAQTEFSKIQNSDSLSAIAQYNSGVTFYRMGEKSEAKKSFDQLSGEVKDSGFLSKLYYNEGVISGSEGDAEESISLYKMALLFNPADNQARENLQKAILELKKRNTPPEKKQAPPKIKQKQASQKLKQLEQKEKQVQQRVQNEKSAGAMKKPKDW
ncbi:MAG: hypothetical protein JST10_12395 [Bacteroidetes bacterium]|nr:hypothetical protein [Bacteroidota bacterium]MBS1633361.1 hypothetical protein [Bacteroidota bacterium]